jgi:hypothetical protein
LNSDCEICVKDKYNKFTPKQQETEQKLEKCYDRYEIVELVKECTKEEFRHVKDGIVNDVLHELADKQPQRIIVQLQGNEKLSPAERHQRQRQTNMALTVYIIVILTLLGLYIFIKYRETGGFKTFPQQL